VNVFLDTNIILDIVERRQPFYDTSQAVLDLCDGSKYDMFIAWHGLATVFYFASRKSGRQQAKQSISDLLQTMRVATTGHDEAVTAMQYGFADLEDAMQVAAAEASQCRWLITRDLKDFEGSHIKVVTPAEFLMIHGSGT
jgi:predicted nucleic acid-binding protein